MFVNVYHVCNNWKGLFLAAGDLLRQVINRLHKARKSLYFYAVLFLLLYVIQRGIFPRKVYVIAAEGR